MSEDSFIWDESDLKEEEVVEEHDSLDHSIFDDVDDEEQVESSSFEYDDAPTPSRLRLFFLKHLKRILIILIIMTIITGFYTINVFTFNQLETNELIFIKQDSLYKIMNMEIGNEYSRRDLINAKRSIENKFVGTTSFDYDIKEGTVTLSIEEIKPLAMQDGVLYYMEDGHLFDTRDESYVVPILFNFDENQTRDVLNALNSLEYSIIKEISAIDMIDASNDTELLLLQMNDGNYVEIYLDQISEKMPYYLQMQTIIKEQNGGEPGVIHLDIGDYYEPAN